jgi:hypothetical protein
MFDIVFIFQENRRIVQVLIAIAIAKLRKVHFAAGELALDEPA